MGKYKVVVNPVAEKHLEMHRKARNKAVLKKIQRIFQNLEETPYEGVGQPEKLKYELSGFWSRRISQKDRIIYEVKDEEVKVLVISAIGHYGNK